MVGILLLRNVMSILSAFLCFGLSCNVILIYAMRHCFYFYINSVSFTLPLHSYNFSSKFVQNITYYMLQLILYKLYLRWLLCITRIISGQSFFQSILYHEAGDDKGKYSSNCDDAISLNMVVLIYGRSSEIHITTEEICP